MSSARPLIETRALTKHFPLSSSNPFRRRGQVVRAVEGVDLTIHAGETVGLVGESGCGKSTYGRMIVRLVDATSGSILFDGVDILKISQGEMARFRRHLQIIFQDPFNSLNPQKKVGTSLLEPLDIFRQGTPKARRERVAELLEKVRLTPDVMERYPHEFSGGQRQRINIARALTLDPQFIMCDEVVSALDVSVQAQVINLLKDLQNSMGLAYLFVSHDLGVIKHMSHRVAVMYLGRIVELGTREQIFSVPRHPYTQALLAAVPLADPHQRQEFTPLPGDVPSPVNPPSGCRFRTRCPLAQKVCAEVEPPLIDIEPERKVACHFVEPEPAGAGARG